MIETPERPDDDLRIKERYTVRQQLRNLTGWLRREGFNEDLQVSGSPGQDTFFASSIKTAEST